MTTGPLEVLKDVVARLERIGVTDYFLVGSLASMYYGRPRFTRDIDLVLRLAPSQVQAFEAAFPLGEYYCPPGEILRDEVERKGAFNLIHQGSGMKVDLVLSKPTEFYAAELRRRRKVTLAEGFETWVASPEDVILKKLDYYREGGSPKHLADIGQILSREKLDLEYLEGWVRKLGLQGEWDQARAG
jgi:hypothetical protein